MLLIDVGKRGSAGQDNAGQRAHAARRIGIFILDILDLLVSRRCAQHGGRHGAPRESALRRKDQGSGGFGGGETPRLSASGSLPGSSIRSVMGWIPNAGRQRRLQRRHHADRHQRALIAIRRYRLVRAARHVCGHGRRITGRHGGHGHRCRRVRSPPAPRAGRSRGLRSKRPPAAGIGGSNVSRGTVSHNPAHDWK